MHNKKEEKKIKNLLLEYKSPPINPGQKQRDILHAATFLQERALLYQKGFWLRIWEQICYISRFTWLAQFVFLVLGCCLMMEFKNNDAVIFLSALSPLIGIIGFTEVNRSFSRDMWELEQVCRYNLKQIIGMKLFILGGADLLVIAILFGVCQRGEYTFALTLIMALLPFNTANSIYLFLLRRCRHCSNYILVMTGIILSLFDGWISSYLILDMEIYHRSLSPVLLTGSLLFTCGLVIFMGYGFLNTLQKEDKTIWNFG